MNNYGKKLGPHGDEMYFHPKRLFEEKYLTNRHFNGITDPLLRNDNSDVSDSSDSEPDDSTPSPRNR